MSSRKDILGDGSNFPRVDPTLSAELIEKYGEKYKPPVTNTPQETTTDQSNTNPIIISPNVEENPRTYIQVPQFGVVIARRETHRGEDMYSVLDGLKDENLQMPSPGQFMRHRENVREAAQGNRQLLYADGTPVGEDVAKDLWGYMSSTDRKLWDGQICWTWLNARFIPGQIETDLKVKIDSNGEKYLEGNKEPLKDFVNQTCWAFLDFNEQGLPKSDSGDKKYRQDDNIRFYEPGNGTVAWFLAYSGRAVLNCYWDPTGSNASLGVFASAPLGARSALENSGGQK